MICSVCFGFQRQSKSSYKDPDLLKVQLDVPNTSSTLVLNFDYFNFVLTINLYGLVAFD